MDMKEKELIEFMHSLWNRGLISVSPDEFDYEWVVWDYLKLRQPLPNQATFNTLSTI